MIFLTLIQTRPAGSDCTAPYDVVMNEICSVKDFIKCVFTQFPNEWGYIGIDDGSIFGNPRIEYAKGKLITENNLKELENNIVVKAFASGGWSRMDYILNVK